MAVFNRLLVLLIVYCSFGFALGSRVSITNNGYRDIVVAISPDVQQDKAVYLLSNIQTIITQASADLYAATRQRSYIQSVQILIPQTWVNITTNSSTWETFQDAEIQIDLPNSKYGDRPYTVQLGGCGDPGQYIHWTPNYVLNSSSSQMQSQFGPAGKVFVKEWARLRYGVFEEHGYTGADTTFPTFYRPGSAQQSADMVPNVCSNVPVGFTVDYGCGVDPQTGLYNSNCMYSFTNTFKPTSSIMSDNRMLSSATHFCDDDPSSLHKHNREAPTKQNAVCDTQSVWSVISKHADFAGNNNLPATIANVKPTFNIVRVLTGARYVLVTDVSSSMRSHNRIGRLNEAARRWIKYDVRNGTSLGIVQFSTSATMLSGMTVVNSETRQQLMDKVPTSTEVYTCIGCGLQMALNMLKSGGKGGVIVLVTDGSENMRPYIEAMYPQLIDAQVQVVSVAFGRNAENKMENLATKTNGKSYFINDNGQNDELNDAFTGSLTYQPAVPSDELTVILFQQKYQKNIQFEDFVTVDFTVGRSLTFRLEYTNRNYIVSFSVQSPSGQDYNQVTYDDTAKLAYIIIPDLAEEGDWKFTLTVTSAYSQDYASVIVTSKSRVDSAAPITVECSVPSGTVVYNASATAVRLVAVVKQGRNRVIGANVRAYIEAPNAALEVVDLEDTGVGADTNKNDGIYSRYYVALSLTGRYTLVCKVNSTQTTYIENGSTARQRSAMGNFNRVQSGGAFRVEQPKRNPYPPSRVTDLKVVAMQVDQMSLTIEWTASGDELDVGTASAYQIKYSTTFDNLMDNNFDSNVAVQFQSHDVIDGSLQPLESGNKQRVSLRLPSTADDVTYYVALRAVNNKGLPSLTSNVVSVKIVAVKPPPTQPPTTLAPPPTSSSLTAGCNGVLTTSSGLLTSPNYPGVYPNNYNCQWTIRLAPGSKIRLTFSHFAIESPFDYVEVYDGSSISTTRLLKHSGSTLPSASIVSSSNVMLVRFVTDSTGNYFRGWRATYTLA
ncbi:LOW QUALITY PROTEIN: calcium-activated chloride channel regulator 4 [Daphnia magna]|uniref:LOW QUALITY PROTEIN: calcium-activated chloride channel regulator 4 n=1 Tax=Daphnia magna TaxID=35525 RepID=UPI001E1BDB1E|nr:LOW QUALITY PROTEIN: calcium-activated chloride channel regulator 4 [Daphnia magna]